MSFCDLLLHRPALSVHVTDWERGRWRKLRSLDYERSSDDIDAIGLALLSAVANQVAGNEASVRRCIAFARQKGCSEKLLAQALVSGGYSILGRAYILTGREFNAQHSIQCAQTTLAGGASAETVRLRYAEERQQLGIDSSLRGHTAGARSKSKPSHAPSVKVMGLPRVGTNYVRTLIEWNSPLTTVFSSVGGWKHEFPTDSVARELRRYRMQALYVVKDPLSELLSLYNYFRKVGRNIRAVSTWPEFLWSPILLCNEDDGENAAVYRFSTPVDMVNFAYRLITSPLYKNAASPFLILRYEDCLLDPAAQLEKVYTHTGAHHLRAPVTLRVPVNAVTRMRDEPRNESADYVTGSEFQVDYYMNREYQKAYGSIEWQFVQESLDGEAVQALGYGMA